MILEILMAACLAAITVIIHAAGLGIVLTHVSRFHGRLESRFWPITWLLIRIAWLLIVFHVTEIVIWGLFFWWQKCLPDAAASFYFSGVTYTTIGYGDVVLPRGWWLFAPAEGLTGILMCGLSTALFFIVVNKTILARIEGDESNLTT
jgi:hypothetical protein